MAPRRTCVQAVLRRNQFSAPTRGLARCTPDHAPRVCTTSPNELVACPASLCKPLQLGLWLLSRPPARPPLPRAWHATPRQRLRCAEDTVELKLQHISLPHFPAQPATLLAGLSLGCCARPAGAVRAHPPPWQQIILFKRGFGLYTAAGDALPGARREETKITRLKRWSAGNFRGCRASGRRSLHPCTAVTRQPILGRTSHHLKLRVPGPVQRVRPFRRPPAAEDGARRHRCAQLLPLLSAPTFACNAYPHPPSYHAALCSHSAGGAPGGDAVCVGGAAVPERARGAVDGGGHLPGRQAAPHL